MKRLLLLSFLCASAVLFSMKKEDVPTFIFKKKYFNNEGEVNCSVITAVFPRYEERELTTYGTIDNVQLQQIPDREIYGEIKENSIISVKSFAISNPKIKKNYGEYRLTIAIDKETQRFNATGNVIFSFDYCEKAQKNDHYEDPLFDALQNDLANFKKNNLELIKSFVHDEKSKEGIKDEMLDVVFTQVLEEAPQIAFPKAYQEKRLKSIQESLYQIVLNKKFRKLKHY